MIFAVLIQRLAAPYYRRIPLENRSTCGFKLLDVYLDASQLGLNLLGCRNALGAQVNNASNVRQFLVLTINLRGKVRCE